MKTVAIIPVRGGSKSIPLKNIKKINGRPLVYWTIDAAVQCKWIDEVYVSTDSEKISSIINQYDQEGFNKLHCINRSAYTATDTASTESVLIEFVKKVESDILILLQATSPLTQSIHLDEALKKFFEDDVDSMLSVVRQKRFIWSIDKGKAAVPINYDPMKRPRRQEFDGFLVENGAFYITKTEQLKESKVRISGKIALYEMPENTYFEIDEPSDWSIIEKLMENRKTCEPNLEKIKLFATDCDGVLTDSGMYYTDDGDVMKKFNTKDGMGFSLLKNQGILTAILTGENSKAVLKRAEKLQIKEVYLGCKNKIEAMEKILSKYNLSFENVAYIGDDLNDLDLLKKVGFSFSVADAIEEVKSAVDYVTKCNGGNGAVREAIDYILHKKDLK